MHFLHFISLHCGVLYFLISSNQHHPHSGLSTFIDYIDTINIKMAIKSYHNLSINHFTFYNTRHLAIAPPFIALHCTCNQLLHLISIKHPIKKIVTTTWPLHSELNIGSKSSKFCIPDPVTKPAALDTPKYTGRYFADFEFCKM